MTEPLTTPDCDLRDFPFMPLDVVRLRDSDIAAVSSGDEFRCAVLLWCASWHQQPAASLPDDDVVLAQLAGYGRVVREWRKVREGALRGWIKCSDGRLYHPVIAEKAKEAWAAKLKQRWATECARIKKANQRNNTSLPCPSLDEFTSQLCPQGHAAHVPRDMPHMSQPCPSGNGIQGTGIGTGIVKTNNFVGSNVVTPPPVESPPPSPDATRRKGDLCKRLRAIGIDAAPHLPVWEETLLQFDDEAIIAVAEIAKTKKPGERIHLNYLAPMLTNPAPAQQGASHETHQRDTRSRAKRHSDKLDEIARASIEREAAAAGTLDSGDFQTVPGEVWPPLDISDGGD